MNQDNSNMGDSQLTKLSATQTQLYNELTNESSFIAGLYLGAITVLNDPTNPDRISLAAHGLREMMDHLPVIWDLGVKTKGPRLGDLVRNLATPWEKAKQSTTFKDGEWKEEIDGRLRTFLKKLEIFFATAKNILPNMKEKAESLMRKLDKTRVTTPAKIRRKFAEAWMEYKSYFNSVAHHDLDESLDGIKQWIGSFEDFLAIRILPTPFEDQEEIKDIIREVENED